MNEPRKVGWFSRLAVAAAYTLLGLIILNCVCVGSSIVYNINVYGQAAREIATSLSTRYPKLTFSGGAGYEGQMHITVSELPDDATQQAIRDWIGQEMEERRLWQRLYLRFVEPRILIGERSWWYDPRERKWTEVGSS